MCIGLLLHVAHHRALHSGTVAGRTRFGTERGRFPALVTFDVLVTKGVTIPVPFRKKKCRGRVGVADFNITNHWNPRDVQNNIHSSQFGTFFNSAYRSFRTKFEIVKY